MKKSDAVLQGTFDNYNAFRHGNIVVGHNCITTYDSYCILAIAAWLIKLS